MPVFSSAAGGLSNREQLHASECTAPGRPWLEGVDVQRETVFFYQPNCGSWSCPYCAGANTRRWSWLIALGAERLQSSGAELSFTTLTSHERLTAAGSIRVFPAAWKKLSARARRREKGGQYVLIPEKHESGVLHAHMLDTFGLSRRWWKDNARECGFGFMAESEFANTAGGAARYASKYLSKQWGIPWPRGFRRIRTSRGYPRPEDDSSECGVSWSKVASETDVLRLAERWEREGYAVRIVSSSDLADMLRELREVDAAEA